MSAIPGLYEGGPLVSDNFLYTFKAGAPISIGQAVALTSDYTVVPASGSGTFLFGVAETAGVLSLAVNVIVRGIVTVVADGAIPGGSYVVPSSTTAGRVVAATVLSAFSSGSQVRAIALNTATAAGQSIQILMF